MSETNSKSFGSLLVATPYESEMVQTVYSRRNGLGARLARYLFNTLYRNGNKAIALFVAVRVKD